MNGPAGPGAERHFPEEQPPADICDIERKCLDLPYADTSPTQRLDIYLPELGDGPFPVVLYIHGGGFMVGSKREKPMEPFLQGLKRGYAVVSVDYRLSGEAIFPAGLQDVKAAIRWVKANGEQHHLDGGRVAACGPSAGGNFAAMMCVTTDITSFDDPSLGNAGFACDVRAGVDWFGPTDFLKMDEQLREGGLGPADHGEPDSPEALYMGAPIAEIPDRVRLASPISYVNPAMAPILIQHGSADWVVPVQQSIMLARAIEERVGPDRFELDILGGAEHLDPAFATTKNVDRVFRFLDRYMK